MQLREINKNPEAPELSITAARLLTDLCFRKNDELSRSDVLFVFGTSFGVRDIADAVADIVELELVRTVIVAGGAAAFPDMPDLGRTEAMEILAAVNPARYPSVIFRAENGSHNTQDNVRLSMRFHEFAFAKKVIFLFRSHACGRGLLTLRKFLPHAEFLQTSVDVAYVDGAPKISRDIWHENALSRSRVWGEFMRIDRYGSRGDIDYPPETKALVEEIKKQTTRD